MIHANNLHLSINGNSLLNNVSLTVQTGEMVVLVGANGAGKTTLLKVIAGDLHAQQGEVLLDNTPLTSYCPRNIARRRAVMPQHSALNFSFSAQEVVEMGRAPHLESCSSSSNCNIVNQAIDFTQINHLLNRDYTTLSGGEKQRVHLARVLAQIWSPEPYPNRYLLLDEPTSSLDIHHQYEMLAKLKDFVRNQTGILLIAHDLNVASLFADRIVVMKYGRVIACGHPTEVYTKEILEEAFSFSAHIGSHPDIDRPFVLPRMTNLNSENRSSNIPILFRKVQ